MFSNLENVFTWNYFTLGKHFTSNQTQILNNIKIKFKIIKEIKYKIQK